MLPKIDIDDVEKSFNDLRQSILQIHSLMNRIGSDYLNKMNSTLSWDKNNRVFRLRDSITYRIDSILFHYTLLLDIQVRFQERIDQNPFADELSFKYMMLAREQEVFLFDSIVFHIISLYDYLGNLIDYICCNKSQSRLKWNGVTKLLHDNGNSSLQKSDLKLIILKWDKDFVNTLYRHRSDLIHYNLDFGNAGYKMDIPNEKGQLEIAAPYRFVHNFNELKSLSQEKTVMINYAVDWLLKKTMTSVEEIVAGILGYIENNGKLFPKNRNPILKPQ